MYTCIRFTTLSVRQQPRRRVNASISSRVFRAVLTIGITCEILGEPNLDSMMTGNWFVETIVEMNALIYLFKKKIFFRDL